MTSPTNFGTPQSSTNGSIAKTEENVSPQTEKQLREMLISAGIGQNQDQHMLATPQGPSVNGSFVALATPQGPSVNGSFAPLATPQDSINNSVNNSVLPTPQGPSVNGSFVAAPIPRVGQVPQYSFMMNRNIAAPQSKFTLASQQATARERIRNYEGIKAIYAIVEKAKIEAEQKRVEAEMEKRRKQDEIEAAAAAVRLAAKLAEHEQEQDQHGLPKVGSADSITAGQGPDVPSPVSSGRQSPVGQATTLQASPLRMSPEAVSGVTRQSSPLPVAMSPTASIMNASTSSSTSTSRRSSVDLAPPKKWYQVLWQGLCHMLSSCFGFRKSEKQKDEAWTRCKSDTEAFKELKGLIITDLKSRADKIKLEREDMLKVGQDTKRPEKYKKTLEKERSLRSTVSFVEVARDINEVRHALQNEHRESKVNAPRGVHSPTRTTSAKVLDRNRERLVRFEKLFLAKVEPQVSAMATADLNAASALQSSPRR